MRGARAAARRVVRTLQATGAAGGTVARATDVDLRQMRGQRVGEARTCDHGTTAATPTSRVVLLTRSSPASRADTALRILESILNLLESDPPRGD